MPSFQVPRSPAISLANLLKANLLRLDEHHPRHCNGPTCTISLSTLQDLLEQAGIAVRREVASLLA
jgi:hypothetical protein